MLPIRGTPCTTCALPDSAVVVRREVTGHTESRSTPLERVEPHLLSCPPACLDHHLCLLTAQTNLHGATAQWVWMDATSPAPCWAKALLARGAITAE